RAARDEADDRLFHRLDVLGRLFLVGAADLADHHDHFGLGIFLKQLEHVDKPRADDRVAPDADARRLADPPGGKLVDYLVGERAAAGDEAHWSRLEDATGQNPYQRLAGRDHPRTVGTHKARPLSPGVGRHLHHLVDRDPLGDADDQLDAGVDRL